jgi:dCTP deaminase
MATSLRAPLPIGESGPSVAGLAGILPSQCIRDLIAQRVVSSATPIDGGQVQPASLDLRLGRVAHRVQASFLPTGTSTVAAKLADVQLHEIDISTPAVLEVGCVYIVQLLERLKLPADLSCRANPKSTTGRLDVFTRLITDYGAEFDTVPAGYDGKLFVEIAPRTFPVLVRTGTRLNQIRFTRSRALGPVGRLIDDPHRDEGLAFMADSTPAPAAISDGLWITIDLQGSGSGLVGYRARRYSSVIDLAKTGHYDPIDFWEPIHATKKRRLILGPEDFYILASKERVRIPRTHAAELAGYDATLGEFRIHYAGFFDPGFGDGDPVSMGSRAVLEVRSHGVPFLLEDGQRIGRLTFERLIAEPDQPYGPAMGSSYQSQGLALSKQFRSHLSAESSS